MTLSGNIWQGARASIAGAALSWRQIAGQFPYGSDSVLLVRRQNDNDDASNIYFPYNAATKIKTPFGKINTGVRATHDLVPDTIEPQIILLPRGREVATDPQLLSIAGIYGLSASWVNVGINLSPAADSPMYLSVARLPKRLAVHGPKALADGNVVPAYTPNGLELQAVEPYNIAGAGPVITPCAVGSKAMFFFRNNGAASATVYILPPMDRDEYTVFADAISGANVVTHLLSSPATIATGGAWHVAAPPPGVFDVAARTFNPDNADETYGTGTIRIDSASAVDVDVFRVDMP